MKKSGAICVKTHYESGFGSRKILPTPSVALIRDLVNVAHENGLPVLLHANSQPAQPFGVQAGVDAFVHGLWTWDDATATELSSEVTENLDANVQEGIGWQPTLQVLYGERDLHDPNYLLQPALQEVLPQDLIDWYATAEGQ